MEMRRCTPCGLIGLLLLAALAACDQPPPDPPANPAAAEAPAPKAAPPAEAPADAAIKVDADPFDEPNHAFRHKIREGQTLNPLLRRNGLSPRQVIELVAALEPLIDLERKTRPGDTYALAVNDEGDVIAFDYKSRRGGDFFVRQQGDKLVSSKDTPPDLKPRAEDPNLQNSPVAENRDPGPGSPVVLRDPSDPQDEADPIAVVAHEDPKEPEVPGVADADGVADPGRRRLGVDRADGVADGVDRADGVEGQALAAAGVEVMGPAPKADAAPLDPKQAAREAQLARAKEAAERREAERAARAEKARAEAEARKEAEDAAHQARVDKARAEEEAREKALAAQARQARKGADLPTNIVELVKGWFDTDDPVRRKMIARQLERQGGANATRRALVRAYKPRGGKTGLQVRDIKVEGRVDRYSIYVPKRYSSARAMPLHISLHGGGGNGPGNCDRRWGADWPDKFILVCPSTPGGHWWSPQGEATVLAVYREVLRDYNVQTDQVTVGGLSNGGTGTYHLATKFPWLWAAVVPRCGARFVNEEWYKNMADMPTFVIHGGADHQIVPSNSRWIVELLGKMGNKPQYIEVPNGGHDFFSDLNPKVVSWMLPKKRKHVVNFTYEHTRGPDPEMIHWLSAQGAGSIKASMKREGATTVVNLDTERAPRNLTVFFPKGYLSRDARIVLNGKVVYTGRIPSSAEHVLESFAATGDLRRVFSGAVHLL